MQEYARIFIGGVREREIEGGGTESKREGEQREIHCN